MFYILVHRFLPYWVNVRLWFVTSSDYLFVFHIINTYLQIMRVHEIIIKTSAIIINRFVPMRCHIRCTNNGIIAALSANDVYNLKIWFSVN